MCFCGQTLKFVYFGVEDGGGSGKDKLMWNRNLANCEALCWDVVVSGKSGESLGLILEAFI